MSKQLTVSSFFAIIAMASVALATYAGGNGSALAHPSGASPLALIAAANGPG